MQKCVPAADMVPQPSACVIDAMTLIPRLKGDHKTFVKVADSLLGLALREGSNSGWTHVVLDVYKETSIKNAEREKRGAWFGNEFRKIQSEHKLQKWRKFLLNPTNTKAFTEFVVKEWRQDRSGTKLTGKVIFVTCESDCYESTSEASNTVEELNSTREEADTRLILHAAHAARSGHKAVVVASEDTDIFLLCLAFKCFILASMHVKCGAQTRTRYVSISSVVGAVGGELCKCLIGMHAFTGCDTVSAFTGRGKITALRLDKQQKACFSSKLPSSHLEVRSAMLPSDTCPLTGRKTAITLPLTGWPVIQPLQLC